MDEYVALWIGTAALVVALLAADAGTWSRGAVMGVGLVVGWPLLSWRDRRKEGRNRARTV